MKKNLFFIALFLFTATMAIAQAPSLLNYQGVARSASGTPLASQPIGMRLTIHDGTATGATVYQETQTPTTNSFGLYNVSIGEGTVSSGTFAGINWASGPKFIEVELDPAGGTSYTSVGSSKLLSVPYSLYANNAGTANSAITLTGTVGTPGTYGSATQVPVITTDAQGRISSATNTTITVPTVSGTTNYVAKFTGASAIGNSQVFDNGTTVGINTATPTNMAKLHISGVGTYSVAPYYQAGLVVDGGSTSGSASGIYAESGWRGVYGRNIGTATGVQAIGVHGRCEGSSYTGGGYGLLGEAVGTGPTNYGVYASASGASGTNYAGYFSGNVRITGSITKGSGTFLIDHPLDPENKYLYHSFVESPDMMNVYNGNVLTDANGFAIVTLPDYFEVLNKDFRYQLTTIGQPAQVWISKEISENRFELRSDKPNVKVSWQVTGVRHDKYANEHRVVPEVEKEPQFKGYYLHAAEWGQPDSKSYEAVTNPKTTDNKTVQH